MMKNDLKNYLITNLRERGLFMIFQIILTFLLPFVTTTETFGLLSIIINNISFALILTSLGIPSALTFFASKRSEGLGRLLLFIFKSTIIQLGFIILLELISLYFYKKTLLWPSENIAIGIYGIIMFLGYTLNEKLSATYNGLFKTKDFIRMSSIFLFFQILLIALNHYFTFSTNIYFPIYILVLTTILQVSTVYFYLYFSRKENKLNEEKIEWNKYLSFAIPAYLANIIQFLATKSDLWLVDFFYNKTEVAYYSLATKIGQMVLILPLMIASVLFPILTANQLNNIKFEFIIRIINFILICLTLIIIIAALIFIPIIWKENYLHSILPLLIIIPGYFAQSQVALYAAYFSSKARIKTNITTSIITLICVLTIDFFLIPPFGIIGAAIALTISNIAGAYWISRMYKKETGYSSIRFFPTYNDLIKIRSTMYS